MGTGHNAILEFNFNISGVYLAKKMSFAAALRRRPSFQFGRGSSKPSKQDKNHAGKSSKGVHPPVSETEVDAMEDYEKKLEDSLTDQEVEATFEKMLVSLAEVVTFYEEPELESV